MYDNASIWVRDKLVSQFDQMFLNDDAYSIGNYFSYNRESLDVNFVSFNSVVFFRSESSRGCRLSRASARFRWIFISRARKSSAECSFRSGKGTRKKKRQFFQSKENHVYGAERWGLISHVAETIPGKPRWFRWHRGRLVLRKCGIANLVTSFLLFVYRLFTAPFFHSSQIFFFTLHQI